MAEQSSRPFYGEYAWAFDLLIDRPVGRECAAILERGGFGAVAYFGAYDPAVHAGATDRLVAVALLADL